MSTLAIIPARGGSKGVPRKNVRDLAGKPLIAWTIENARQARTVDRVVVSTDDPEIGAVAREYGAEVVWRPAELAGDTASSEAALLHALEFLAQSEGYQPDLLVFLQCTSPLTAPEDIDATVQALLEAEADSALAVVPFHYFLWRPGSGGDAEGINHDKRVRLLRQQRAPEFLESGAVYVMRVPGFLAAKHRFFGKTAMHVMPPERRLEIDEPVDFTIAEVLLRERQRQDACAALPDPIEAVVLDFDGVFTDNRVLVFEDGREAVLCHRGDGMGLARLKRLGVPLLVISTEENPVVQARCRKLGIACQQGVADKLAVLRAWLAQQGTDLAHTVYVGNDVNDLDCLRAVGCGVVVGDAHRAVRAVASIHLESPGGQGAIRELCDLIAARGNLPAGAASGRP
ncbi:MAG: acylneuraminate cytidylyltransferase [Armatimonadetes bacterium]|nr:acylneuraminate cytidylyltransferase [Armatimonadota bacterium]